MAFIKGGCKYPGLELNPAQRLQAARCPTPVGASFIGDCQGGRTGGFMLPVFGRTDPRHGFPEYHGTIFPLHSSLLLEIIIISIKTINLTYLFALY